MLSLAMQLLWIVSRPITVQNFMVWGFQAAIADLFKLWFLAWELILSYANRQLTRGGKGQEKEAWGGPPLIRAELYQRAFICSAHSQPSSKEGNKGSVTVPPSKSLLGEHSRIPIMKFLPYVWMLQTCQNPHPAPVNYAREPLNFHFNKRRQRKNALIGVIESLADFLQQLGYTPQSMAVAAINQITVMVLSAENNVQCDGACMLAHYAERPINRSNTQNRQRNSPPRFSLPLEYENF